MGFKSLNKHVLNLPVKSQVHPNHLSSRDHCHILKRASTTVSQSFASSTRIILTAFVRTIYYRSTFQKHLFFYLYRFARKFLENPAKHFKMMSHRLARDLRCPGSCTNLLKRSNICTNYNPIMGCGSVITTYGNSIHRCIVFLNIRQLPLVGIGNFLNATKTCAVNFVWTQKRMEASEVANMKTKVC